jgi:4-hydroxythreonine-4-phosphate dehydrogenase
MNPLSRQQLLQSPWTIFRPPATHAAVLDYLSGHDGVVLATPSEPSQEAVASWLLMAARGILEQGAASGLIVFGGDTASALLAACGIQSLEPAGEVLPGVPCSWITLGNTRMALITKAGGFGAPDLLNRMIGEINKI